MNKRIIIALCVVCVVAIGLSVAALVIAAPIVHNPDREPPADVQYVLYVGTNDKDTNLPVFTQEEAKEQMKAILLEKFGGYTIQEANGGWKDGDTTYQEYTLVVYLSDTTTEAVYAAADEMITVFRQSSILIQTNRTVTEFYSGSND